MRRAQSHFLAVVAAAITASLFSPAATHAADREVSIRWVTNSAEPARVAVEVHGLERTELDAIRPDTTSREQWQQLLSVYAGQGSITADLNVPPMLGEYRLLRNIVRFEPRFPLQRDVTYRAVLRARGMLPGRQPGVLSSTFTLPLEAREPSTRVAAVYPSADVLPENLLKFYVHFSAPMSRGHIYEHIRLLDDAGKAVELPFLEIDEELWNPAMTQLTLFIDPGRIKRGVKPLEDIGPSLEAGKAFTLVIDSSWRDADGSPLVAKFEKAFRVAAPDRTPPDPTEWKLTAPQAGGQAPLLVEFPEPMDYALAQRLMMITDAAGRSVEGEAALVEHERQWRFRPDANWQPGNYFLVVQTTIEDLAGNNIGKPFEVDLFDNVQRRLSSDSVKLKFEAR